MKTAVLYIGLVCLPLLGLIGVLYLGERLVPPRGIAGTWDLNLDQTIALTACVHLVEDEEELELVILQSGPRLHIQFQGIAQTPMIGEIRADSIRAHGDDPGICAENVPLHLEARTQGIAEEAELRGRFFVPGCPCGSVSFVALRRHEAEN